MTDKSPTLGYFVSRYPAISHTFILREIAALRALGHEIATASINPPDRSPERMPEEERREAEATYCLKHDGVLGAMASLLWAVTHYPARLLAMAIQSWRWNPGWRGVAYAIEAAMVARWMHRLGLHHLHVHFGNVGASIGMRVKRLTGCHLSLTVHGPDEFDDVFGQQLAAKVAESDRVVCISQFAIGQLMRLSAPEHWSKLVLCRLGVDPDQFPFQPLRESTLPQLLCVGRLAPAKCQVLLVHACARLAREGLRFRLVLVGDGPDRSRVESAIVSEGVKEHVQMTGAVAPTEVRRLLGEATVFVLASLAEGIPVVLMEAMSSGVPCVSTPVNGIPELISHEQTGLLALPGDIDSLVVQLRRMLSDVELRERLAKAGRTKVERDFNLPKNVDRLSAIFQSFAVPRGT
jgi:colanic acid/amylovoran biosynthesis glycosyltransferase